MTDEKKAKKTNKKVEAKVPEITAFMHVDRPAPAKDKDGKLVPVYGSFPLELCMFVKEVVCDRISTNGKPYTMVRLAPAKDKPHLSMAVYDKTGERIRDAVGKFITVLTDRDPMYKTEFPHGRVNINKVTFEDGREGEKTFYNIYNFEIVGVPS